MGTTPAAELAPLAGGARRRNGPGARLAGCRPVTGAQGGPAGQCHAWRETDHIPAPEIWVGRDDALDGVERQRRGVAPEKVEDRVGADQPDLAGEVGGREAVQRQQPPKAGTGVTTRAVPRFTLHWT